MAKRPNIVIFCPDSYRGDVLCHLGNQGAVTPHLDALVSDGAVSYSNAFAQNPVCTPSRCSFMTGWYPHVHGHRTMMNLLKDYEPNLFSVLRRENYYVWWGGKNDLFAAESRKDLLRYCDTRYYPEEYIREYCLPTPIPVDDPRHRVFYRGVMSRKGSGEMFRDTDLTHVLGAVDFINSSPVESPFCLFLPLQWPHPAYQVEEDFYDLIDPASLPPRLPVPEDDFAMLDALRENYHSRDVDEEAWKDIQRIYYAMCAKIDDLFGKIAAALKQKGIYDDTLIIFLSDHGDFTGDYSLPEKTHGSLQDSLLRVPFIIKPPASFGASGGIRTHLTELVDMPATIYDLLGLNPGYACQGMSLRGSLRGDDSEMREAVFAEVGARKGETAFKNLGVKKHLPHDFYAIQSQVALGYHDRGTYAVSARTPRFKYVRRGYIEHNELYDIEHDPGELHNLSGKEEYRDIESTMERLMLDFFMTTGDVIPHREDARDAP